MNKLIFVVVASALFQGYLFDRQDIIDTFSAQLSELDVNYTTIYTKCHSEEVIVIAEIANDTTAATQMMTSQITALKNTIIAAKNTTNVTAVLTCLDLQLNETALITTTAINASCYYTDDKYPDMSTALSNIFTLNSIPNITLTACGQLNPLTRQDESFETCITDKIIDMTHQISGLQTEFETATTATINDAVKCLSDQSAIIANNITAINLAVNLCLI